MMRERLIQRIRELSHPIEPIPTAIDPWISIPGDLRGIVFDVYGTLFVSGSGDIGIAKARRHPDALLDALKDSGFVGRLDLAAERGVEFLFEEIERAHRQRRAEGVECPEVEIRAVWGRVLDRLAACGWIVPGPTPAACARLAVEYECRVNPVWPIPGWREVVEDLRQRGVHLGIASNAQFYTPLLFPALMGAEASALGFRPDLCVYSFEHGAAKPSATPFRILGERFLRLGTAPAETICVGNDMLNDIAAAASAGFRTALFAGDARSLRMRENDPRCRDIGPDAVVTHPAQLLGSMPAWPRSSPARQVRTVLPPPAGEGMPREIRGRDDAGRKGDSAERNIS